MVPSMTVESSPGRYQALWILDTPCDPIDAEELSKRIAYYHADQGADKSGWDLTQLLRVPQTLNFKYNPPAQIKIIGAAESYALGAFSVYPQVEEDEKSDYPFPAEVPTSTEVLEQYKDEVHPNVYRLFQLEPQEDWSKALWNLEMLLCESNLTKEQIFAIARDAACNKYRRDGRSDRLLWKEVCKAWNKVRERNELIPDATVLKPLDLLTDGDIADAARDITFVDQYIQWARGVGDAAAAYHQAGGFVCLSALLAGTVRLPTSFGVVVPNLWFLLLADTTLTRKSTALDLAIDMLVDLDADVVMATDGSIEGLFTSLSIRGGQPSIFLRDEFSGLLEAMTRKDYYAGMAETFTKLYDGKFQKRVLRKEIIEIRDPIFIFLAGGIRTRIQALLNHETIASGFLPRFILITAKSNLSALKPLGPPSEGTTRGRAGLVSQLNAFKEHYQTQVEVTVGSVKIPQKRLWPAELTPEAWLLYNEMELRLLESGMRSVTQDLLTPTMDRLAKSGLKAALLIAASRRADERVIVEERDIYKAFSYVVGWREYAMEVLAGVGVTAQERVIQTTLNAIKKNPGVLRSTLMQTYHLTKRDADAVFETLEQRGLIERVRAGRSERLSPIS
jgi:hypothetical protein